MELAPIVQRASEERSGEIDSAEIRALFMDRFVADSHPVQLLGYRLTRNGRDAIEVSIQEQGVKYMLRGEGEGAIAAFVDAWMRHSGQTVSVIDYSEHAIGEGTDAEAASYLQLEIDGNQMSGVALDRDTVSASLKAILSAINRAHKRGVKAA
jgi:2-isopropylmalate synthase